MAACYPKGVCIAREASIDPAALVVIGLISGTSVDSIDVAVARFHREEDALVLQALGHDGVPWPEETRRRLLAALPPAPVSMGEVCALDALVGEAFAGAAMWGMSRFGGGAAGLVCSHGQTVFHLVSDGRARATLQLGQPAIIAEATGLPVVSDLRARDVAAGGQGAPLASTLDALWLAAGDGPRVALNLGGIANISVVGRSGAPVIAYDTGPASCLLDLAAARITGGAEDFDRDGRLARAGRVREDLLQRLLAEPYYSAPAPKSTGRELFDAGYVARHMAGLEPVGDMDLMATLTMLTARTVADACRRHGAREVVAAGGGVRNPALMAALGGALASVPLVSSEAYGLPADAKEAYLFALLGYLAWHGLAGNVASATGATGGRILGRISPGSGPLRLPGAGDLPRRLMVR